MCILLVLDMIVKQKLILQVNPSLKKTCKCCELVIILNEKFYKMKYIVRINTILMNSIVEEKSLEITFFFLEMYY